MAVETPDFPLHLTSRPSVGVGEALRRYWLIPLACAVLLGAAGAQLGLHRTSVFTASSKLSVGTTNVNTPAALGGFAASAPTLAGAYSRSISAAAVVNPIVHRFGVSPALVRSRLVASPVPETPVIRIDATGPSAASAVRLANAASRSLARYAGSLNGSTAQGASLLRRYQRAQLELERAKQARDLATGPEHTRAAAEAAAALLRAESLASAYRTSQAGVGASDPLQVIEQASSASSDRAARIELLAFTGLLGGLVVGCAIALAIGNRRLRR